MGGGEKPCWLWGTWEEKGANGSREGWSVKCLFGIGAFCGGEGVCGG
ncbi:hypothetical protein [Bartonella grahamii]|nr:hypothetical protein [Bartonella grahamii]